MFHNQKILIHEQLATGQKRSHMAYCGCGYVNDNDPIDLLKEHEYYFCVAEKTFLIEIRE